MVYFSRLAIDPLRIDEGTVAARLSDWLKSPGLELRRSMVRPADCLARQPGVRLPQEIPC
jgi:hypothetical protein